MGLAVGHTALRAPACLFRSLCRRVLVVDFTEILGAHHDWPLDRHFLDYVDECEHLPLGHFLHASCRPLSGTWRGWLDSGFHPGNKVNIYDLYAGFLWKFNACVAVEGNFRAYLLTFMPISHRKSGAEHPVTVLHLLIVAIVQGVHRVPAGLLLRPPGADPGPDRV